MRAHPYLTLLAILSLLTPLVAIALHLIGAAEGYRMGVVDHLSVVLFVISLGFAVAEEFTHLRKSKPVVLAAGLIWVLIAWSAGQQGETARAEAALRGNLLQYSELMLFFLVAMTYVNAMSERRLFVFARDWFAHQRVSYRRLFWLTGLGAFFLSPLLDNLTTALLMGAVVVVLGTGSGRFLALASLNVVLAANAGGVFSPFGDITSLMVWQQNIQTPQGPVGFWSFFQLFPAALVSYLVPAVALSAALPQGHLHPAGPPARPLRGAWTIVALFVATIATAAVFQGVLHLPGVIGMLTGLSYLQFFGFYLKKTHRAFELGSSSEDDLGGPVPMDGRNPFDIFEGVARVEWDTLFFLYGVALSVGGLGYLGHLDLISGYLYTHLGTTLANVGAGLLSSVLENIPIMFMVLQMNPEMSLAQWLLVTFATGTGGSLLAIGSAAGVAMMGQARGSYTFFFHLKWTPVIVLGFILGVFTHLLLHGML